MLAMYETKNSNNTRMDSHMLNKGISSQLGVREDKANEHTNNGGFSTQQISLADEFGSHRLFFDDLQRAPLTSNKRKFDGENDRELEDVSLSKKTKSNFSIPLMKRSLKPIPPLLSYCSKDKTYSEVPCMVLEKNKINNEFDSSTDLSRRHFQLQTGNVDFSTGTDGSGSPTTRENKDDGQPRHRDILLAKRIPGDREYEVTDVLGYSKNQAQNTNGRAGNKRIDYKSVTNLLNSRANEDGTPSPKSTDPLPEKIEVKRSAFREVTKRKLSTDSSFSTEVDTRLRFNDLEGHTERKVSPIGMAYNLSGYKPQVGLRPFSSRFNDLLNITDEQNITNRRHLSPTPLTHAPTFSTRSDVGPNIGKSASPSVIGVTCPVGAFRSGFHQDMLTTSKSAFSPPSQSAEQLVQQAGILDYLQKTSPVSKAAFPTPNSSSQYYDSIRRAFKNFSELNMKSSSGVLPGILPNGSDQVRFTGVPLPPPSTEVGALSSFPVYPRLYDGDPAIPFSLQKSPSQAIMPLTATALNFAQNWCAKCNATFRMTSDLVYHMRTHHKRDQVDPSVKRKREEKLRCGICGETFRERHHLSRHMTSHNG
ncbi:uncharacterized protein [Ptychodera flava]|uniref:uncharacterized protein n=1 Tax=Ptychodera flava TaxID=63121 RepID=UPI00396A5FE5